MMNYLRPQLIPLNFIIAANEKYNSLLYYELTDCVSTIVGDRLQESLQGSSISVVPSISKVVAICLPRQVWPRQKYFLAIDAQIS